MTDTLRAEFEAKFQAIHKTWLPEILFELRHDGRYASLVTNAAWEAWQLGYQAGAQAERDRTITVPDQMQQWKGMNGETAWHLIHRHADGWADVGKMMGEWLEANRDRSTPA